MSIEAKDRAKGFSLTLYEHLPRLGVVWSPSIPPFRILVSQDSIGVGEVIWKRGNWLLSGWLLDVYTCHCCDRVGPQETG
jgi:hypothetical protein